MWLDRLRAVQGRQGELFARSGPGRERAAALSAAVDALNARYGRTVIGHGQGRRLRRAGRRRAVLAPQHGIVIGVLDLERGARSAAFEGTEGMKLSLLVRKHVDGVRTFFPPERPWVCSAP